jgi:hypothetical protein
MGMTGIEAQDALAESGAEIADLLSRRYGSRYNLAEDCEIVLTIR